MSTATRTTTPVQGRWGWHAADYSTFREVKEYHRLLLRDLRATKRFDRWHAKLPHNRKGPEPPLGLCTDGPTYRWVLEEYRKLRRPQPTPEAVAPLDLPEGWREHAGRLAGFHGPR
jgi:hypothetical protein